jgi:hypothetical protein
MAKIGINISLHVCPSAAKALNDFLTGGVREQDAVSATHQQQLNRQDGREEAWSDKSTCRAQNTAKIKGKRFRHGSKDQGRKFLRGWMLKSTKG